MRARNFFILCILGVLLFCAGCGMAQGKYGAFIFEREDGSLFMWDPELQHEVTITSLEDIRVCLRSFEEER